jgi:Class II flagellar assembly regulator
MQGFGKQRELIRVQCKMQTPIIDRTRRMEAGSRKPTARFSKAADFTEHLRAELPSPAEHAPELAPAASLSTILGAQEAEADENERRGAARYGAELLDRLAELRLNLLSGTLPAARLHALARALRVDRRPSGDPRIDIVIEEIELRVQVEIAKLANSYQPRRPTGIETSGESIFCTLSTA